MASVNHWEMYIKKEGDYFEKYYVRYL